MSSSERQYHSNNGITEKFCAVGCALDPGHDSCCIDADGSFIGHPSPGETRKSTIRPPRFGVAWTEDIPSFSGTHP